GVGGARTGNCEQSRSGAEEKALDVHFLTSSQNRTKQRCLQCIFGTELRSDGNGLPAYLSDLIG
ncbi:hypothetical protein, partial [Mesorhizobium sp. P5_C1]